MQNDSLPYEYVHNICLHTKSICGNRRPAPAAHR